MYNQRTNKRGTTYNIQHTAWTNTYDTRHPTTTCKTYAKYRQSTSHSNQDVEKKGHDFPLHNMYKKRTNKRRTAYNVQHTTWTNTCDTRHPTTTCKTYAKYRETTSHSNQDIGKKAIVPAFAACTTREQTKDVQHTTCNVLHELIHTKHDTQQQHVKQMQSIGNPYLTKAGHWKKGHNFPLHNMYNKRTNTIRTTYNMQHTTWPNTYDTRRPTTTRKTYAKYRKPTSQSNQDIGKKAIISLFAACTTREQTKDVQHTTINILHELIHTTHDTKQQHVNICNV